MTDFILGLGIWGLILLIVYVAIRMIMRISNERDRQDIQRVGFTAMITGTAVFFITALIVWTIK